MSLDISKLTNVRTRGDKTIARCPACAEVDQDQTHEHLIINASGRFGCVVYPGRGSNAKAHRRRVFELVGDREVKPLIVRTLRTQRTPSHHPRAEPGLLKTLTNRFCRSRVSAESVPAVPGVPEIDTREDAGDARDAFPPYTRSVRERSQTLKNTTLETRRYVLRTQEGDYVLRIELCELETVKVHFVFTRKREEARQFSYEELWSKYDTVSVGMEFTCGFSGGTAERLK
jgi:hypothetical protein